MRNAHIALGLILACSGLAHADISDSGQLWIGGQGIIEGTMTVKGSAFSVGGTTFSVAGGSITLGGRLNAAASGIKWADGSTSTTAASGGGGSGDASLSSTQTFSGANTFLASTTISGPLINGWRCFASTTAAGNDTIVGFPGVTITTGSAYKFLWNIFQSGPYGNLTITVNDDTGTNYQGASWCHPSAGGALAVASNGASGVALNETSNGIVGAAWGEVGFEAVYSMPKQVAFSGNFAHRQIAGAGVCQGVLGWFYSGSAVPTSFQFRLSAGAMVGNIYLCKMETNL